MERHQYIVMPTDFTEMITAKSIKTAKDFNDAVKAGLERIRPEVQKIVERDGGQVVYDGSAYGRPGDLNETAPFMLVNASEAAAVEIAAKVKKVSVGINHRIGPR
jgi:hypothetical protein